MKKFQVFSLKFEGGGAGTRGVARFFWLPDFSVWVEVVEVDGFEADDGGGAENGVGAGGARDLGGGAGEAHDDVAVVGGSGDVAQQLDADVGGVEVGEDENVGTVPAFFFGQFDGGGERVERDIGLEFAVDAHVGVFGHGLVASQGGGGGHAPGVFAGGRAVGGVAEQGDGGGAAEEVAGEFSGFHGDGGKLRDVGLEDHRAVGEEQCALGAEVFEVGVADEQHGREDPGHVGQGLDGVEQGAVEAERQHLVSADQGVGLAVLDHQCAEVLRAGDDFGGVEHAQALVALDFFETAAEEAEIRGRAGVEQADEIERDFLFGGDGAHRVGVSEEDGRGGFEFDETAGGLDDARILAFGEDDPFRVVPQFFEKKAGERAFHGIG